MLLLCVVCLVFDSILEAVASNPAIESCKIDKSGTISTGNKNVSVQVKDGMLTLQLHNFLVPIRMLRDFSGIEGRNLVTSREW